MSVSMQAISLGVHWLLSRFPTKCVLLGIPPGLEHSDTISTF